MYICIINKKYIDMKKIKETMQNMIRCLKVEDPNTLSDHDYFKYYIPVAFMGMLGFMGMVIIMLSVLV